MTREDDELLASFKWHLDNAAKYLLVEKCTDSVRVILSDEPPTDSISELTKYGSSWEDDKTLKIFETDLDIQQGIIAREAFMKYVPLCIKHLPEAWDLGWEYARLFLSSNARAKWHNLWLKISKKQYFGSITYHPPISFPIFSEITKNSFLREIYSKFMVYERYNLKLDKYQYLTFLEDSMLSYQYPLSEVAIKCLNKILSNPELTIKDLVMITGETYNSIHRTINTLRTRKILRYHYTVRFHKLGLMRYIVQIFKFSKSLINRLVKVPFFFSMIPLYGDLGQIVAYFILPKTKYAKKKINEIAESIAKNNRYISMPVDSSSTFYNLSSYNTHLQKWDLNIDAWTNWLIMMIKEKTWTVLHNGYDFIKPVNLDLLQKLDIKDLQILSEIFNKDMSLRILRKKLKMSTNTLIERIKKLKYLGILYKKATLSPIGLTECLFIMAQGYQDRIIPLFVAFKELPKFSFSITLDTNNKMRLYALLELPSGTSIRIAKNLIENASKYYEELYINFGGPIYGSAYSLPLNLWDDHKKTWKKIVDV